MHNRTESTLCFFSSSKKLCTYSGCLVGSDAQDAAAAMQKFSSDNTEFITSSSDISAALSSLLMTKTSNIHSCQSWMDQQKE